MLKIIVVRDLNCPVITCDFCGEIIEDAEGGNYEWEVDEHGQPVTGEIFFTHKGRCFLAFEEERGGSSCWYTGGLEVLFVYLVHNLKVDLEEAERRADLLDGFR
jgi:hypothetical protein